MISRLKLIGLFASAAVCLFATGAQAQSPLKSGDRMVFLGDSITQQRIHTRYVMNYFTMRYPGLDVTFRNAGWNGDTSDGALGRLQRDVLSQKPTVVSIFFGMNDAGYGRYDQGKFDKYVKGLAGLVAELRKAHVRIVLLTPGCVDLDQWPQLEERHYNDVLKKFAKGAEEFARKEKLDYVNLHDLMLDIQLRAKAKDPKWTMIPDGVHPSEPGQAVIAYAMLKALGCKDQASGLEIDAAAPKATPDRCKVDDLKVAADSITFTRSDEALPTFLDPAAGGVLDYLPFMQDLNQYNFKVTGLKAGKWKLTVEGVDVGTFTEKDLAGGVNLAGKPGPWQKLGDKANGTAMEQEYDYFFAWRQVAVPSVSVPNEIKAEWEAVSKKAISVVEQYEAVRLKIVPASRAWKWSLTLQP